MGKYKRGINLEKGYKVISVEEINGVTVTYWEPDYTEEEREKADQEILRNLYNSFNNMEKWFTMVICILTQK